jgi:Sap, sulfolipid-1-addressing protein
MWSSLVGMSLLLALNPILLGIILLIISRPRPVQNLFAYLLGALAVNLPLFLAPLALLHLVPGFASFAGDIATPEASSGPAIVPAALGMGVVLLALAGVMVVRYRARARAMAGGGGSDAGPESTASTSDSEPTGRVKRAAIGLGSKIQELLGRLRTAWDSGSLVVSFVFGMLYLPSLTMVLLIDISIVTSGVEIGAQVGAAIAFVVGFLAILEITLLSCAIAPERTGAVLRPLHEWAAAHSSKIVITFITLGGFIQLARGLGAF